MLDMKDVGTTEDVEGWCPYCQQNTGWLITVLAASKLLFACQRCKKIEREITLPDHGGQ